MDELSKRRLEYINTLIKCLLMGDTDRVEEYTELIRDLDKMVLKHLNWYWSDVQLKYLKS